MQQDSTGMTANKIPSNNDTIAASPSPPPPSPDDILCGRGKVYAKHPGNRKFNEIIYNNVQIYANAKSRVEKSLVVSTIVKQLKADGHRFMKQDKTTGTWYELDPDAGHEKTGHAIRDLLNNLHPRGGSNHSSGGSLSPSTTKSNSSRTNASKGNSPKVKKQVSATERADNTSSPSSSLPSPIDRSVEGTIFPAGQQTAWAFGQGAFQSPQTHTLPQLHPMLSAQLSSMVHPQLHPLIQAQLNPPIVFAPPNNSNRTDTTQGVMDPVNRHNHHNNPISTPLSNNPPIYPTNFNNIQQQQQQQQQHSQNNVASSSSSQALPQTQLKRESSTFAPLPLTNASGQDHDHTFDGDIDMVLDQLR